MNIQQVQAIIAEAVEKHNGIVKKEEHRILNKTVKNGQ